MTSHSQNTGSEFGQSQMFSEKETGRAPAGSRGRTSRSRKSASAFKTISEVAKELEVQQHVLRFWETKFSQIRPLKRGGGRRYYRPEDVQLLHTIRSLLYTEGYTIKGVQKLLREQGKNKVIKEQDKAQPSAKPAEQSQEAAQAAPAEVVQGELSTDQKEVLQSVLSELKELRGMIKP